MNVSITVLNDPITVMKGDGTDPCKDSSLDLDFFSFLGLFGPI